MILGTGTVETWRYLFWSFFCYFKDYIKRTQKEKTSASEVQLFCCEMWEFIGKQARVGMWFKWGKPGTFTFTSTPGCAHFKQVFERLWTSQSKGPNSSQVHYSGVSGLVGLLMGNICATKNFSSPFLIQTSSHLCGISPQHVPFLITLLSPISFAPFFDVPYVHTWSCVNLSSVLVRSKSLLGMLL